MTLIAYLARSDLLCAGSRRGTCDGARLPLYSHPKGFPAQQEWKDGVSKDYGQTCPLAKTAEIVAERWTPLILRQFFAGRTRFNQFIEDLPGISPRLLAERLKRLEAEGIIERHVLSDYPPRVEYALTEAGRALRLLILAMSEWGLRYCPDAAHVTLVHRPCGGGVRLEAVCADCGDTVAPDEVALQDRIERCAGGVPPLSRDPAVEVAPAR